MGVAGAALPPDISQLVSCVLSLRFLMRVEDDTRVIAREVRVHKKMAARIIKVGLPPGIQNMVISLSNVLVQVSVNGYGAAAWRLCRLYESDGFNIMPVSSFSMAATTFVGQNFGAGKIDRVKKGTFVTLGMCVIYTILTGILLLASRTPSCTCSPAMKRSLPTKDLYALFLPLLLDAGHPAWPCRYGARHREERARPWWCC